MSYLSLLRTGLLSKSISPLTFKQFAPVSYFNPGLKQFLSTSNGSEPEVIVEIRDSVQWIRLNRPARHNALSIDVYAALIEALKQGAKDEKVKITAVTGTGKYFSSGNDSNNIEIWKTKQNGDLKKAALLAAQNTEQLVSSFIDFPKPLIAVVNGPTAGIMAATLGLYDFVIASDNAIFSSPSTKYGTVPEGCSSYTFPRILGPSLSAELLYFNQTINAKQARKGGLVSRVIPAEELASQVEKFFYDPKSGLVPNSVANSLMQTKALVRDEATRQVLHQVNKREAEMLGKTLYSEETLKARKSDEEERDAKWKKYVSERRERKESKEGKWKRKDEKKERDGKDEKEKKEEKKWKDGKENKEGKDERDGRDGKENKEGKDERDGRDGKENKEEKKWKEGKDGKENKDGKDVREGKENKEGKDGRNEKDGKEGKEERKWKDGKNGKDFKENKEGKNDKESKEVKDAIENKEAKDVKQVLDGIEVKEVKAEKDSTEVKIVKSARAVSVPY